MVNTKIEIAGLTMKNPVIPASGTFGFGKEFVDFYDLNVLGSISIKGTTVNERYGNPLPRIAECSDGMLNAVGLQNPGVKQVIEKELKDLSKIYSDKIIANISGFALEEYVELAKKFDEVDSVGILEVNISCPNVHGGGMAFGTDPKQAARITRAVKQVTTKPVFIKLSPNVTNIVEIAKAVEEAGADGISMINTLVGMRIDVKSKQPILSTKKGGYSGKGIFPIAIAMIYQVYEAVNIPIIGMGGVTSAEDVIEMMLAGATCVQVGAANLIDPYACYKIIQDLPNVMKEYNIESLQEIVGLAHR